MTTCIQPGYEVSDLLREIEAKDEEIALWKNAFLMVYGATTRAYSAKGRDEKKDVDYFARTVEGLQPQQRPVYLAGMAKDMIEALTEKPTPSTVATEGPDLLRYDLRNLNDRRRDALISYMEKTGKSSITTQEARHVLQTAENRKLDRKAVWRALRAAREILGASLDLLGGVLRLLVPSKDRPGGGGGDRPQPVAVVGGGSRSSSPRSRRWSVPWDGAD
jgi:hypothetical protein